MVLVIPKDTPTFEEMSDDSKVKVGLEAEPHRVVELLEVPLQRLPRLHHYLL